MENLNEIKSGDTILYKIVVKTSDRLGSSTEADIKIQLFGKKGKSRLIHLKNSTRHKIPFRRSNVDEFEVMIYDIGVIRAISIGHSETDIGKFLIQVIFYYKIRKLNLFFI